MRATVFVLLGLLLVGCGREAAAPDRDSAAVSRVSAVTVDDAVNGRTIRLRVGQRLVLRLSANPSTGYGWEVDEIDDKVLHREPGPSFTADAAPVGAVGGGGTDAFGFVAKHPGNTRIRLEYRRTWEPATVRPAKAFAVDVAVG